MKITYKHVKRMASKNKHIAVPNKYSLRGYAKLYRNLFKYILETAKNNKITEHTREIFI
ncbi:MAG: hypothetical protein KAJ54_01395 [Candidatus Aenigmarchaeota archaeon]|nr:hypothetical protein [Candidatus Aenigmarchaeota archaeon]MCK5321766.1 hypothetical protein [Candidatus Aenigmarchaeota archaeon]